jgi:hypothetical protein
MPKWSKLQYNYVQVTDWLHQDYENRVIVLCLMKWMCSCHLCAQSCGCGKWSYKLNLVDSAILYWQYQLRPAPFDCRTTIQNNKLDQQLLIQDMIVIYNNLVQTIRDLKESLWSAIVICRSFRVHNSPCRIHNCKVCLFPDILIFFRPFVRDYKKSVFLFFFITWYICHLYSICFPSNVLYSYESETYACGFNVC